MSTDVAEIKVRHKKKLEKIRAKEEPAHVGRETSGGYTQAAIRNIQGDNGGDREDSPGSQGSPIRDQSNIAGTQGGSEGLQGNDRTRRGSSEGTGYLDTANIDPTPSTHNSYGTSRADQIAVELTPEEVVKKKRELARQRKQRQRDKQKEEGTQTTTSSNSDSEQAGRESGSVPSRLSQIDGTSRFRLKNPLAGKEEKVKLFSVKEAEEEKERLSFIYAKGSGLLDDVLEIIVKGHEKVTIWQLEDDEANMLAEMHLEKAKKEESAARSARALLSIYDRLFTIMLIGPRVMRTGSHIKEHGGVSFK